MNREQTESNSQTKEKKRKWVRFDFSPHLTFSLLLPQNERLGKEKDLIQKVQHHGEILKLERDGVLITTDQALEEGCFLNLCLNLQNGMLLADILGKVKRVEKENDNQILMGVEFCLKEALPKPYGQLAGHKSFENKLKEVILDYLLSQKRQKKKLKIQ